VKLSEKKQPGHVVIQYRVGDSGDSTQAADRDFVAGQTVVDFSFTVDSPDSDNAEITVFAQAFFENSNETPHGTDTVHLAKCKGEETTTTTEAPTPTSTNEAPARTAAPTTTAGAIGGVTTSSSGGGSLPSTGTNALPMLIGALVPVLGGGGLLIADRLRARQVK
jgi:hypothetical protein